MKPVMRCGGLAGCLLLLWLAVTSSALADERADYRQALALAAQGQDEVAVSLLQDLSVSLPAYDVWSQRAVAAAALLQMRQDQQTVLAAAAANTNLSLAAAFTAARPLVKEAAVWPVTLLAVVLPGAGHAWQGRWRDAATAALLVWPMLFLTLWAARRRMGPVTVFFAIITLWLWSGTIFSSLSLAERAGAEAYMTWWQGLWQASALPGRPW